MNEELNKIKRLLQQIKREKSNTVKQDIIIQIIELLVIIQ